MGNCGIFFMDNCFKFAVDDWDGGVFGCAIDLWNNQILFFNRISIYNFSLHDTGCCVLGLVVQ